MNLSQWLDLQWKSITALLVPNPLTRVTVVYFGSAKCTGSALFVPLIWAKKQRLVFF